MHGNSLMKELGQNPSSFFNDDMFIFHEKEDKGAGILGKHEAAAFGSEVLFSEMSEFADNQTMSVGARPTLTKENLDRNSEVLQTQTSQKDAFEYKDGGAEVKRTKSIISSQHSSHYEEELEIQIADLKNIIDILSQENLNIKNQIKEERATLIIPIV